MIKLKGINNFSLKEILDKELEMNLMISKIPEIKKKLIEYSKIHINEMIPNLDEINRNFEFTPSKSLSFEPNLIKETFFNNNKNEIRELLVDYITEYDYYTNNKDKILNEFISLHLLNTFRIDSYIINNFKLDDDFLKEKLLNIILKIRYHLHSDEIDKSINEIQQNELYLIHNKKQRNGSALFKTGEVAYLKMISGSFDILKYNSLYHCIDKFYNKQKIKYFNKIKEEDLEYINLNIDLKVEIPLYIDFFFDDLLDEKGPYNINLIKKNKNQIIQSKESIKQNIDYHINKMIKEIYRKYKHRIDY